MTRFIIRRFIFLILAIFAATLIVFVLSRLQGDPRNVSSMLAMCLRSNGRPGERIFILISR